ncbi:MAG: restriction endonuclease subunit S [Candidatus Marinimicrobia bacterium]|nr:restriction endonuclease subunit S [Candidatus Neomarinimicrobiota bacterium]
MTDPNENRPGYKKTKVGWIPEGWKPSPLASMRSYLGSGISRPFFDDPSQGIPVLRSNNVQDGHVVTTDLKYWHDPDPRGADLETAKPHPGDILINFVNGSRKELGKAGVYEGDPTGCIVSTNFFIFRPDRTIARSDYLAYHFCGDCYHRWLHRTVGFSGPGSFNQQQIASHTIPLPPLPEQQKIADILSTWDDAIEQTRDLIQAKKKQKKAIMQQLLTGKRRLPGFAGEWEANQLSSLVTRIKETADDPSQYFVLSITAGTGFVSQADKFSRVIAGKHIENYILLRRGEFSYNKGNSYRYPQGCVYQLHEYDEGLVPSVFYSFRVKPKKIHDAFLKHCFIAGLHNPQLYRWINTGVRNNGLLNLNASDFFNIALPLPKLPEQRAIAAVLDTADSEIQSLTDQLTALQQQKKGLMQRLLTGQVRVKV